MLVIPFIYAKVECIFLMNHMKCETRNKIPRAQSVCSKVGEEGIPVKKLNLDHIIDLWFLGRAKFTEGS